MLLFPTDKKITKIYYKVEWCIGADEAYKSFSWGKIRYKTYVIILIFVLRNEYVLFTQQHVTSYGFGM